MVVMLSPGKYATESMGHASQIPFEQLSATSLVGPHWSSF